MLFQWKRKSLIRIFMAKKVKDPLNILCPCTALTCSFCIPSTYSKTVRADHAGQSVRSGSHGTMFSAGPCSVQDHRGCQEKLQMGWTKLTRHGSPPKLSAITEKTGLHYPSISSSNSLKIWKLAHLVQSLTKPTINLHTEINDFDGLFNHMYCFHQNGEAEWLED